MKIAIVTPVLGSAGGMGRVAEEQANRLAARGHEVTVFCPSTNLKPRLRYGHGAWVPDLANQLSGFEIVHLHYPFLGGVGAVVRGTKALRQKGNKVKLIVTYHMDLIGRGIFRPIFRAYQKFTLPIIIKAADQVLVSSLDYAENGDLKPFVTKAKNKFIELPFGVDTDRFAPREPDAALLAEWGIKPEESVILFVGGLNSAHYFKGASVLLRAFAELKKEAGSLRLVLVGAGDLVASYKKMAANLKISDQVIFASSVSPENLPRYYNLADVFVLPSTDRSEAFGLVLLEAQASGVPVIATDLAGMRTVFEDEKTGLVVPVNDSITLARALAWIFAHPDEHAAMRVSARARVMEKYRWDLIIDRLEAIYQGVGGSA